MLSPALSLRGKRCRRAIRIASGLGAAALAGFHAWLLAGQFAAGRLADPGVMLRWLLAAALVAGLVALYQARESIWSRKGIAIWVLAALLHGPAVASATADQLALPEAVASVVVQVTATAGSLALALWILGSIHGITAARSTPRLRLAASAVRVHAGRSRRPFSPRPPPLA